ncbi:NUDIX hydrolase [Virgibacillus ainsalahensis]
MDASDIIAQLKHRTPRILGYENYFRSAVLLPLIEKDNETHVLFEVRSMQIRQPGDICFPGGRIDREDKDPTHTAIRETTEELGIGEETIKDVIPLDYMVSDSGRIVYPFTGKITSPELITPNKAEVEEVFTVPLNFFLETKPEQYKVNMHMRPEADFPFDSIVGGENYNWQVRQVDELFYRYDGKVIWGLTAKILTHFIELVNDK